MGKKRVKLEPVVMGITTTNTHITRQYNPRGSRTVNEPEPSKMPDSHPPLHGEGRRKHDARWNEADVPLAARALLPNG